jgi:hypothetical protein
MFSREDRKHECLFMLINNMTLHPAAALGAGIISGVVSTLAQVALWWLFAENSWLWMLNRDSRLAAAMVMGQDVLPMSATVDWQVMAVATLIHFTLSIGYGFVFAFMVSRLDATLWLAAGFIYGLAIYAVNMYGMTFIFPWFIQARDWITILAHIVFGTSLAAAYKKLSRRQFGGSRENERE